MARLALALALCFVGAAHGFGGTTNPECPRVTVYPAGNVIESAQDCENKIPGESCNYSRGEDDEIEGVCLQIMVEGDIAVLKCSCCLGEGVVPEDFTPPYGGADPSTVLPNSKC